MSDAVPLLNRLPRLPTLLYLSPIRCVLPEIDRYVAYALRSTQFVCTRQAHHHVVKQGAGSRMQAKHR